MSSVEVVVQLGEEVAQRGQAAAEIVQLLVAVVELEDTETVVVDIPPNAAHTAFVVGDILAVSTSLEEGEGMEDEN